MPVIGGFVPLMGVEKQVPRTAKLFTTGFKLITGPIDLYFCPSVLYGSHLGGITLRKYNIYAYTFRNKKKEK